MREDSDEGHTVTTTLHPLAEEYLSRLERAARDLPPEDRHELLTEIRGHLHAGLPDDPGDAEVRNLLQELGPPEDIVAAARPDAEGPRRHLQQPVAAGPPSTSPWGALEIIAVLCLTAGTFVAPVIGPVVGIVLVWASVQWTRREKWVATVLTFLFVIVIALGLAAFVSTGSSSVEQGPDTGPIPGPVVSEQGVVVP